LHFKKFYFFNKLNYNKGELAMFSDHSISLWALRKNNRGYPFNGEDVPFRRREENSGQVMVGKHSSLDSE
jgi:hypothetical protein